MSVDGIDIEHVPVWVERLSKKIPLTSREMRILADYTMEFPDDRLTKQIRNQSLLHAIEPVPEVRLAMPDDEAELVELAGAAFGDRKKTRKKRHGAT